MNIKPMKTIGLTLGCGLMLSACGGGGGDSEGPNRFRVELNSAKVSLEPLASTSASSFATHFKNGLYTSSISQVCVDCSQSSSGVQDSAASVPSEGFTGTNNQVSGVDEADRIKYDGEHLYVIANPYFDPVNTMGQTNYIKVYDNETGSMEQVSTIYLPEGFVTAEGLYLQNDDLLAVGNNFEWITASFVDVWHPVGQRFDMAMYDVSSPETPEIKHHFEFDGYLLSSRKIDNKLYLVSSFSPTVDGVNYGATSEADKEYNFNVITAKDINDLLPKISIDGGNDINLVTADNCFIPQDATSDDGYSSIVTLTTIDIENPHNMHSVCVNALTHDIYASKESIYFMGVKDRYQGVIHRFALDNDLTYAGTGNVDGGFGSRNQSFRLSEHDGHLRVVTSKNTETGRTHQLFVFDIEGENDSLPLVAQLPNEQHPEPIGKPNENIFAVRYFENKAYVVTFEVIDPLYVIDISQPSDPFIAGELEVPGFSSYLHPIGENLLLGVGQSVDNNALPDIGQPDAVTIMPVLNDSKVALFDVSDPANPIQVHELIYENSYTPVEWEHHALTYQVVDENYFRFAMPMSRWVYDGGSRYENETFLNLLDVNISEAGAELVESGALVAPDFADERYYIDSNFDRSVIHGDKIYYVHGNDVIEGDWMNSL